MILSAQYAAAQSVDSLKQDDVLSKKAPSPIRYKSTFLSAYYGISNYLGDLGGHKGSGKGFSLDDYFKKRTSFVGVSFSYIRKEAIGLRLAYTSGMIAGSDQDANYTTQTDRSYYRFKRNLDFQSKISEWSVLAEVYPLKFLHASTKCFHWNVQPYLLLGVGRYKFNPQGTYYDVISGDDVWVDLQPLHTEGQGMDEYPNRNNYKLVQLNIPYGWGINYAVGAKTSLGFEFVGRKLFTDYLDDVSTNYIDPALFTKYLNSENAAIATTINNKSNLIDLDHPYQAGDRRGNPKKNDFYYSFNVKLSIQINKQKHRTKVPKYFMDMKPPIHNWYKYDNSEICE